MNRQLQSVFLACALLPAASRLHAQMLHAAPAPEPVRPAEEAFKTIQALKGVPSDQCLQAVGGAAALKKTPTRVKKGNLDAGGTKSSVQVLAKAPNKRATGVMMLQGLNVTAYDGETGWTGVPGGRHPENMTRAETEAFSLDSTFYFPIEVKTMFAPTRVRPSDKIGAHDT